jgi:hypothetical protein
MNPGREHRAEKSGLLGVRCPIITTVILRFKAGLGLSFQQMLRFLQINLFDQ